MAGGQRRVDGVDEVVAGRADLVLTIAEAEGGLGGNDQRIARPALDRFTEDLLGRALGVDVGAVEHGQAGVEADVDQAARFGHVGAAPGTEQRTLAPEGTGAEGEDGHAEAGRAEVTVFHGKSSRSGGVRHCTPPFRGRQPLGVEYFVACRRDVSSGWRPAAR